MNLKKKNKILKEIIRRKILANKLIIKNTKRNRIRIKMRIRIIIKIKSID